NNVSAFVGGANEGERSVAMAGTDCALVEVAQAVNAAERAIKKLKKRNPQLKKLVRRERKAGKIKEDK
ncbi:MAG: hypothetical protein J6K98_02775, partial [Clostridia bacterium]|nr:hypothetical protein [Clostridia bacterium]